MTTQLSVNKFIDDRIIQYSLDRYGWICLCGNVNLLNESICLVCRGKILPFNQIVYFGDKNANQ
mgnify:CR=1 FL=1